MGLHLIYEKDLMENQSPFLFLWDEKKKIYFPLMFDNTEKVAKKKLFYFLSHIWFVQSKLWLDKIVILNC